MCVANSALGLNPILIPTAPILCICFNNEMKKKKKKNDDQTGRTNIAK